MTIVHWVFENKEWLFSGLGITVFTVILILMRNLFKNWKCKISKKLLTDDRKKIPFSSNIENRKLEKSNINKSISRTYFDRSVYNPDLIPIDILRDIHNQPLLLREDYKKTYIGNKIQWILKISYGYSDGKGIAHFSFNCGNDYISIYTALDPSKHPEILRFKTNDNVAIAGTISNIDALRFDIDCEGLIIIPNY